MWARLLNRLLIFCCLALGWSNQDGACKEGDQGTGTCEAGSSNAKGASNQQAPQALVSCGAHKAPDCASCPKGNGAAWCHGECMWFHDKCVKKSEHAKKMPNAKMPKQPNTKVMKQPHVGKPNQPSGHWNILAGVENDVKNLRARLADRKSKKSRPPTAKPLVHGPKASFLPDGRFPLPSSQEFEAICGPQLKEYAKRLELMYTGQLPLPTEVLYVSQPTKSEGVAEYMQQSLNTLTRALENNFGIQIAWKNVNLTEALVPTLVDWHQTGTGLREQCNADAQCNVTRGTPKGKHIHHPTCGFLRNAYDPWRWLMKGKPPTTNLNTISCAACFLNALFQPSPRLPEAMPQFGIVQKAVNDHHTLSIAIYMRSNLSEGANHRMSDAEHETAYLPPVGTWTVDDRFSYYSTVRCALQLEERWAAGFDRVVWFIASDDSALRNTMIKEFDETGTGRRSVMSTNSHGRHSRPNAAREQPDGPVKGHHRSAIEAIADWWLLGETDLAIVGTWTSSQSTFARTAFARGARARSAYIVMPEGRQDGHPRGLLNPREIYNCGDEQSFYHMWR